MHGIAKVGAIAGGATVAGLGARTIADHLNKEPYIEGHGPDANAEPGVRAGVSFLGGIVGLGAGAGLTLFGATMLNATKAPGWAAVAGGVIGAAAGAGALYGAA